MWFKTGLCAVSVPFLLAPGSAALSNKISLLKGQTGERKVLFDSSQVRFGSNVLSTRRGLSPKSKGLK